MSDMYPTTNNGLADWRSGYGPPPADLVTDPGEVYLDLTTGDIYRFIASGSEPPTVGPVRSVAEAVDEVRLRTQGTLTDELNVLGAAYTSGDGVLVLAHDPRSGTLNPGTILSAGLNDFYVLSYDGATKTATVIPKQFGSFDADIAADTLVRVNPRTTDYAIYRTVCDAIRTLASPVYGLYGVRGLQFVSDGSARGWTLPPEAADMRRGLRLRYYDLSADGTWNEVPFIVKTLSGQRVLWTPEPVTAGATLEFTYAAGFTVPIGLTDDLVNDCGLLPSMIDLPSLHAASALLLAREDRRNQITAQGDARRAAEVPNGANVTAARIMRQDFERRAAEEYAYLLSMFPVKRYI